MCGLRKASGEEKDFRISGPSYLTIVDWNKADHRMIVAASLVKGVYVLAGETKAGLQDSQRLARPWWEFFHFQLIDDLLVDEDIFGAIFRYSPPASSDHCNTHRGPSFVIAFRGTSFLRDFKLDFKIIINELHSTTRFAVAIKAVQDKVNAEGVSNLWLTGHSLGAAIAMLAGKTMAKAGKFLETFLFNPPFVSPLDYIVEHKKVRDGLLFAATAIKTVIVAADDNNNKQRKGIGNEDTSAAISGWTPLLFVNQQDRICSGYIGHFEHRKKLEGIGARSIARVTSQISLTDKFLREFLGILRVKDAETSEPLHLLPSANLTVNQRPSQDFKRAHELRQWWSRDLLIHLKGYIYE